MTRHKILNVKINGDSEQAIEAFLDTLRTLTAYEILRTSRIMASENRRGEADGCHVFCTLMTADEATTRGVVHF